MDNLDSKIVKLNGEKVFSAREVMNICGYYKWERFYGAINRTLESSEESLENHITHYVKKNTGGRPKEDYWLTFYGLMKVLEKADKRKDEVVRVYTYLEKNYKNIEPKSQNKYIFVRIKEKIFLLKTNMDYLYISLIFLILFTTGVLYFFSNYTNFFIHKSKNIEVFSDQITHEQIENDVMKDFQEKYVENIKEIKKIEENIPEHNFLKDLNSYIESGDNYFYQKDININNRTNYLYSLTGAKLIEGYFILGNSQKFRDACSLLSPNLCLSASKSNLGVFTNFWNKTKSGYENVIIKDSQKLNSDGQKVYCVKYDYKLQNDLSTDYITETFNYSVSNIYGYEQIEQRYCENITKGTRQLSCPYELNNYYCENIFDN